MNDHNTAAAASMAVLEMIRYISS